MKPAEPHVVVQDLTVAYGDTVVLRDLNFTIRRGEIFVIMGASGGGKSTLLRSMIGLLPPAGGEVFYDGLSLWSMGPEEQSGVLRRFGVLYQNGALWSSLTLAENIALPLQQYTTLNPAQIRDIVSLKLSLVGLSGCEERLPAEISGGMRKRAALARAMALDPEVLFFDEPSAGLDPISAHLLDELIVELRDSLRATVVVVTHDLASIFAIGTNSVFLDAETRTMTAAGAPRTLLAECGDSKVIGFLTRGAGIADDARTRGSLDGGARP